MEMSKDAWGFNDEQDRYVRMLHTSIDKLLDENTELRQELEETTDALWHLPYPKKCEKECKLCQFAQDLWNCQ
jgi:hypothetical protein